MWDGFSIRPPPEGRPPAAADGLRTRSTYLPSRHGGGDDLRGDVDTAVLGEQLDAFAAAVDLPGGVEAGLAVGHFAAHGEVEVGADAVRVGVVGQNRGVDVRRESRADDQRNVALQR